MPNAIHSLDKSDALENVAGVLRVGRQGHAAAGDSSGRSRRTARSRSWRRSGPRRVTLWQATNPEARNFRLDVDRQRLSSDRADADRARTPGSPGCRAPPEGWTAFFVELTFPSGGKYPFKFTTAVRVLPDTLPLRSAEGATTVYRRCRLALTSPSRTPVPRQAAYTWHLSWPPGARAAASARGQIQ